MNTDKENDFMKALQGLKQISATSPRRSVEIVGSTTSQAGWADKALRGSVTAKANVNDWNKVDMRRYVAKRFSDRFSSSLPMSIAQASKTFADLEVMLEKHAGTECTPALVKDYIDFVFQRHIDSIIQREGSFGIRILCRPAIVLDYARNHLKAMSSISPMSKPAPQPAPASLFDTTEVGLDDLQGAFKINAKYFVQNYGVILPVNYLMYVKKKSKEDAVKYVANAITKLAGDIDAVMKATLQHAPYPDWFDFKDAESIISGLKVTFTDQARFSFIRG